ncbi:DUF1653 domain-containing protein [Agromyces seonyuensis]|uniref:DUF1653 domain-containing protein n=1 Tax=Agromyces seonyuensis TaxID=2662446 RepID=A0A6I4NZM6_9MICO|nr:DUF1653 domain-containing protein [Agromyces seonyuensis]MWB97885.1 DUF1653 domain-containing protein [Agromyces seonyuensis]
MDDAGAADTAGTGIEAGVYRHFKGNRYEVLGVARHSETEEPHVVYRPIDADGRPGASGLWVRPASMWSEHVERDGYSGPRFAREA